MKQILTLLFLFATTTLLAQTLYTRTDSLAITQDSVTLHAGQYRGSIQWQHSPDGQTWDNLSGKTDQTIKVSKYSDGYYRAEIMDGACFPVYSDTARIQAALPVVTTIDASGIVDSAATIGGIITSDGGAAIIASGICWNTTGNPTIADNKTQNSTITRAFTSGLTGLNSGTTYYVRAYATNSKGTGYGNMVNFKTSGIQITLPIVATYSVTDITISTATCGGTVTYDGRDTVTVRGLCWNTTGTPTIADSKTLSGDGTGAFTFSFSGLTPGTTYYVRAYATNSIGTGYGSQVSFKTNGVFTDSRDGNVYATVQIGTQTWMAENLAYSPYSTPLDMWSANAACYYVFHRSTNTVYYNYTAALNSCPTGWHLPSEAEWTTLSDDLGGDAVAGGKMKSVTGWDSPNTGASNESGFNALPDGYLLVGIGFLNNHWWSGWWSISQYRCRFLEFDNSALGVTGFYYGNGYTVRCIKD